MSVKSYLITPFKRMRTAKNVVVIGATPDQEFRVLCTLLELARDVRAGVGNFNKLPALYSFGWQKESLSVSTTISAVHVVWWTSFFSLAEIYAYRHSLGGSGSCIPPFRLNGETGYIPVRVIFVDARNVIGPVLFGQISQRC